MLEKLRALSDFVGRAVYASKAGMTFGGERDLFEALGYKPKLSTEDYRERFERNGIAARCVDALPKATWRNGAEIIQDDDPETTTDFEEAWDTLQKRLNVWSILLRADILAGLGQYAVVLIGAPGDLEEPLEKVKIDDILYLSPFSEKDALIEKIDEEKTSPRFGMPELYNFGRIIPSSTSKGTRVRSDATRKVHWSRVLHIADGVLDEQIYGTPRLKNIWNYLDDLEKVSGSGSEAYWLRVHQGIQFNVDKDLQMNTTELSDFKEQVEEFSHGLRRHMRTRGMDINVLGSDVSPFSQQVDAILALISGSTGIPKRILVGSEMGHLASTQDRNNWHERIEDRRTEYADPWVVRPFINRLMGMTALPTVDEYEVRWPHITKMDEGERADVAVKLAGIKGDEVITGPEIRDRILQLPPLDKVIDLDDDTVLEGDGSGTKLPEVDENGVPVVAQRKKLASRGKISTKQRTGTGVVWPIRSKMQ